MSENERGWITLQAEDGHQFRAYHAPTQGTEIGRIVLAPEIFGINHHIRAVCDGFAADGWRVIAPDLFERAEPAVELPYNKAGIQRGRALKGQVSTEAALLDLAAALAHDWKVIFKKTLILINLVKSMKKTFSFYQEECIKYPLIALMTILAILMK